jgi:hypothetical protein
MICRKHRKTLTSSIGVDPRITSRSTVPFVVLHDTRLNSVLLRRQVSVPCTVPRLTRKNVQPKANRFRLAKSLNEMMAIQTLTTSERMRCFIILVTPLKFVAKLGPTAGPHLNQLATDSWSNVEFLTSRQYGKGCVASPHKGSQEGDLHPATFLR